jgi:acetyl-CoA carboxylase/biotin carboxylase 1
VHTRALIHRCSQVLGRDVYQSNEQIGGTQIMYANGISHQVRDTLLTRTHDSSSTQVVTDELKGVQGLLQWLAFVPPRRGLRPPTLDTFDPVDRCVLGGGRAVCVYM